MKGFRKHGPNFLIMGLGFLIILLIAFTSMRSNEGFAKKTAPKAPAPKAPAPKAPAPKAPAPKPQSLSGFGEKCGGIYPKCKEGSCVDGTCKPPPSGFGEGCGGTYYGAICKEGDCINGTCKPPPSGLEQGCGVTYYGAKCKEGVCINGTCKPTLTRGEYCSDKTPPCGSGLKCSPNQTCGIDILLGGVESPCSNSYLGPFCQADLSCMYGKCSKQKIVCGPYFNCPSGTGQCISGVCSR